MIKFKSLYVFALLQALLLIFAVATLRSEPCLDIDPTIGPDHEYPPGWRNELKYSENNPDEMMNNAQVGLGVVGGFPPFHWQADPSSGFHFETDTTEGRGNTLYAEDMACGTVTVRIVDDEGQLARGYLRVLGDGEWKKVTDIYCGSYPFGILRPTCTKTYTCTMGKYRFADTWRHDREFVPNGSYGAFPCNPTPTFPKDYCHDPGYYPPKKLQHIYRKEVWAWRCVK